MATIDECYIDERVAETLRVWSSHASKLPKAGREFSSQEQKDNEAAYDGALSELETEIARFDRNGDSRLNIQARLLRLCSSFCLNTLGLDEDAMHALEHGFLPAGTQLADRARRFDPQLGVDEVIQACRNVWTACGLQPLMGMPIRLTPSIFGYSMLYPYSDNLLDQQDLSREDKLLFSERFRRLLQGERVPSLSDCEDKLSRLIAYIEQEYSRERYPDVFASLLAIHSAQQDSVQQVHAHRDTDLIRLTIRKGGSSVLADACLARGVVTDLEARFAFHWGVLLQLGDDLQDVREDLRRGSMTLFSRDAAAGKPLDRLAVQLFSFSDYVAAEMDTLSTEGNAFKSLLRSSWQSLILRAISDAHEYFTPRFVEQANRYSPLGLSFLRERQQRLAGSGGLHSSLVAAYTAGSWEASVDGDSYCPCPSSALFA